ncbi:PLP-dependent aminotransferase family protein [Bacillus sonorensis]|uniref:HTH-type transcriptional regulator YdeL n=2 Tax=Bacillus sonorensis TaxID=119858 RepID=M5P7F2_9BACI|nr:MULTISPECIES: PLP-dependent aminotransferase family protein [Bacillus]TWK72624.1 HTH-type transcriptional regulatory protein GabR [Bacillus paralicheniformis]ASB90322.1 putative HTH-type transcriptional regulator YdeL [Bacillus sonorensis]EME75906.1 HTH-type transcriptional regulator YdeL [Bacillus sonorensis L12]MCF7619565.1 PLP-dependent aminotransferase family protein [Bacillus sonorensis]MCY7855928.1 PLP-dependent aminotransferase family protein [Bacillus sonorensis]
MEITPYLQPEKRKPLYQQLYLFIKNEIHMGRISAGTKLPSKRALSKHLNVSQTTVEHAYEQLTAEGYLISRPRKGWYAAEAEGSLNETLSPPLPGPTAADETPPSRHIIDFHHGHVDLRGFPFSLWKKTMAKAAEQIELFQSGPPAGDLSLRMMIAAYLRESRGVMCTPEQVIIGAGTPILLELLCRMFEKGTAIGFENPGFHRSKTVFKTGGFQVIPISVDNSGIAVDELRQHELKLAYVTPSHQFPLGMVMPIGRRLQLLDWAASEDAYIIEDDYDGEFRYAGQPIPSLQGLDQNSRVIYMGTFSKSLIPSLRVGYMVLPVPLVKEGQKLASLYKQTVSRHVQWAIAHVMQNGDWQRHINRMRTLYRKKRKALLETVRQELGGTVAVKGENAGLHVILEPSGAASEEWLISKALDEGVKVYPVSASYDHPPKTAAVLLGFGGLSEEEIKTGIKKLKTAWRL